MESTVHLEADEFPYCAWGGGNPKTTSGLGVAPQDAPAVRLAEVGEDSGPFCPGDFQAVPLGFPSSKVC